MNKITFLRSAILPAADIDGRGTALSIDDEDAPLIMRSPEENKPEEEKQPGTETAVNRSHPQRSCRPPERYDDAMYVDVRECT